MRVERQLSVFLENKPGALAKMCEALAGKDINMLAISVSDTADYAVVRMILSDPDGAMHVIEDGGALVVENDVLLVDLDNRVGALGTIAGKLSEAGVNIDYLYCAAAEHQQTGVLVLRTQDPEKTMKVLS